MLFISAPFGNYLKFENTISVIGTYTLHPRPGRLKQIIKTLRYIRGEGWVNRLGLRNPGIESGLSKYKRYEEVLSIAGLNDNEWLQLLEAVPYNVDLELNLSCPNIEENGIPFHIIDISKEYKEKIVDYMLREYANGNTPNPDILCNREIKFNVFLKYALKLKADYLNLLNA